MANGAAVMVRDLRKSYRDVAAVRGIDLEINRGEVFALLGPNGAGKTTTVEILEGFRRRDHGTVDVLGEDPARAGRAWRARIGIVLQLASTGPELAVLEIVRHFAAFYPASRRAEEAIALVGLTSKAGSRIGQLSGGQTRRLDVALGIVGRPELLFLDEPTTGFDPEARRQFWELIKTLRGVGWDPPTGARRTVETGTPTATIAELAGEFGGEIPGLTVTRPTLEDVYLDLIAAAGGDEQS